MSADERYKARMAEILAYIQAGVVQLDHIKPTWRDRLYRFIHGWWPRELAQQEYDVRKRNADTWLVYMANYRTALEREAVSTHSERTA